jgi:DNA repair photolyase
MASGYSIIDPQISVKVVRDARRIRRRGLVQLCTTVDAWAPDAQRYELGRKCLEALLAEPGWTVRILTKNAAVANDFDLIQRYRDRVLVGLSLTGPPGSDDVIEVIEPNASSIAARMEALSRAHRMGLRTYINFCPLLPRIADERSQIDELVRFAEGCNAEQVFAEAVNPRGRNLLATEEALRASGHANSADGIAEIRRRVNWSPYVVRLIRNLQGSFAQNLSLRHLQFLLYSTGLTAEDTQWIQSHGAGVVWL